MLGLFNHPAAAAGCPLPQTLAVLPVTLSGNIPIVPTKIDGRSATLVFDTAADRLLLTEYAAQRLGLAEDRHGSGVSRGVNGSTISFTARIPRLSLGAIELQRQQADVVPFTWPSGVGPADGFLAGGILFAYDVDIDLPHRRVTLYRARFCPDPTPPWPEPYLSLPAASTIAGHAYLAISVTLEGRTVPATIDSGAETSVVSRRLANILGITDADLARDRPLTAYGFGPGQSTARLHRFSELRIGGEVLTDPTMAVTDLPDGSAGMLLGEDWLQSHRVWLSATAKRVAIAPPP
jgi:predicted aspartyl protease